MQLSTILITGGAGYIGLHTGILFAQKGIKVILFDEFQPQASTHFWANAIVGDYGDSKSMHSIFSNYCIDAIIHCQTFNPTNATNSFNHYQNDLVKTINLIEQMRNHHIRKIIFISCASVFGNNEGILHADSEAKPTHSQAKSKAMIEGILADCAKMNELSYIALRLFSVAGSNINNASGTIMNDQTVAAIIDAIQTDKPFLCADTNYRTSDGSIIRDYVHIWDVALANWAAYQYLNHHEQSDTFNIGSGRGISAKQLVKTAEKLFDKKIKIVVDKNKIHDSVIRIADIGKTIDLLGWRPHHSDIEFILKTTYNARI